MTKKIFSALLMSLAVFGGLVAQAADGSFECTSKDTDLKVTVGVTAAQMGAPAVTANVEQGVQVGTPITSRCQTNSGSGLTWLHCSSSMGGNRYDIYPHMKDGGLDKVYVIVWKGTVSTGPIKYKDCSAIGSHN